MKTIHLHQSKGIAKGEKERLVLFGLVELYLESGKPVGSNTLKDSGFEALSSATIRNYFSKLENEGYLEQAHASGGRVPTTKAFQLYASEFAMKNPIIPKEKEIFTQLRETETKEIAAFMQRAAEHLTLLADQAVFLSAPRFDHDYVASIKLVPVDFDRCLSVLITDFGAVNSEIIHLQNKLSSFALKRIESYFHWRLTGFDKPENLEPHEEEFANKIYNELMVRYIIGYSHFIHEEIYRTGLSKLLHHSEFQDPLLLANALSLFEDGDAMRSLLRECIASEEMKFWIGDDLSPYTLQKTKCAIIAAPYRINGKSVGAVGLLGPSRANYRELFGVLNTFVDSISHALTHNLYKYKITYREAEERKALTKLPKASLLIEDKRL